MFHCCANFVALANVANTNVPPIADGIIAISNAHFLPQEDMSILFAYASAVTLQRTRLVSPSNRQITLPFLRPINAALLPPTDPNVGDYRSNPFRLKGLEEFAWESTDSAAGPNNHYVVQGLTRSAIEPMPRGDVFTLTGTSTTAAVAATWTQLAVTWADILPQGRYVCVGMDCIATNQIAARLTFENQWERPGSVCSVAEANRPHTMFSKGGLGVWGRFTSTRMPIVEVLNDGTDNAHRVYLDLIRIA